MTKRRRDARLLAIAAALLLLPVAWLVFSSRNATRRREATLAGVPEFPAPNQPPRGRPLAAAKPPSTSAPPPAPPPPRVRHDAIDSFVLQPGPSAAMVRVNALLNTPLFDRLRECQPDLFRGLDDLSRQLGLDVTRDIDRLATAGGGFALSGFFEGRPVAEAIIGEGAQREEYRGQTILSKDGRCAAQMKNVVLASTFEDCRPLIDRALAPTPEGAQDELYGDVFMRADLAPLRGENASPEIRALLDGLQGLTLRANVWDSMAVTLEGAPQAGRDVRDLAQMARGAIALVKGQLDEDQVELQALADLAQVSPRADKLEVNLALPAQDLFDRLRFPCPGRDAGQR